MVTTSSKGPSGLPVTFGKIAKIITEAASLGCGFFIELFTCDWHHKAIGV
jgi:hypothetical protein